jgi:AraC family transcriptional regulator of adaptative response/methylated-DNA-[protein]-cysteine methyltransferase
MEIDMATMIADQDSMTSRPNDAEAWRAVEHRDQRYDGRVVYAVRSTGIYCKPSCASRRPAQGNVRFFAHPDEAEQAGFRACRRCRPREDGHIEPAASIAVDAAREYLDQNAERGVPLAELAAHTGMSASHLQRTFKQRVGVSPKEYQDAQRVRRFKARLRAGDTVSRATYEAGFGSSSRVYERTNQLLGMTPASYRRGGAGLRITYAIADAPPPVSRVLVATTERGVCAVELGTTDADVERALRADFPNAEIVRSDAVHTAWVRAVLERVQHPRHAAARDIPLDVDGTAFQWQVWKALQAIPAGERRSYGEIAAAIGRPNATRAVARACATNKVAVVIPCHRVVRDDGALAGYKWGVERKRRLLEREAE